MFCAGPQEERESAHEAFMHAMESAKPVKLRMPGLQEFAAAVSEGAVLSANIIFILHCSSLVFSSAVAASRNHPAARGVLSRLPCSILQAPVQLGMAVLVAWIVADWLKKHARVLCSHRSHVRCLTPIHSPSGLGAPAPHPLGHIQRPVGPHLHRCGPAECTR